MNRQELIAQIKAKKSLLCVGLDTDINKIPTHLLDCADPVFEFNKEIIDATHPFTVAYKPNTAFYESRGLEGWQSLERTIEYLNSEYPEVFTIADAKRGDIGNTSKMYAEAFLNQLDFDSVTVAPYMGEDSVKPFLEIQDKWTILLGLTSNKGAFDFQFIKDEKGKMLHQEVLDVACTWGNDENLMFVTGATKADQLQNIRKHAPTHFLLVPGGGAQGGSLEEVMKNGMIEDFGLLINSSRGIIYAGQGENFAEVAGQKAQELQAQMADLMY
jgi:orotidine-5'-phosphate decarboxylase